MNTELRIACVIAWWTLCIGGGIIVGFKIGDAQTQDVSWTEKTIEKYANDYYDQFYQAGYNQALDQIALVNLEFIMKNEKKTMGELVSICRQRSGINPTY